LTAKVGIAGYFAGRPAQSVWITRLHLRGFYGYGSLDLAGLACTPMVFYGPNGAGKTNLMDAVSLLAPGHGLRSAPSAGSGYHIAADTSAGDKIQTGLRPDSGRRLVKINGREVKAQDELSGCLIVWWLTPQLDKLLSGEPAARRRFFNRLIAGLAPRYHRHLRRYQHLQASLAQINDADWAAATSDLLDAENRHIFQIRRQVLDLLNENNDKILISLAPNDDSAPAHLADFMVQARDNGRAAKKSSTGEQKDMVLDVFFSAVRLLGKTSGRAPVLILDDVAAFLDSDRRQQVFQTLAALKVQAWLTGTDRPLFDGCPDARYFKVDGHQVNPE